MSTTIAPSPTSKRAENKALRRARIFAEARRMITEDGFDALSTRTLAKAAGVSQPTLYNLIGSKGEIVFALAVEAIERIETRLKSLEGLDPLELAEAVVLQSTGLFAEDEAYYRAAMIAIDRLIMSGDGVPILNVIISRSEEMAAASCRTAIEKGFLKGNISPEILGEQMYITYYTPFRNWTLGLIDMKEFQRLALRGFYMCMAVDAEEGFQHDLLKKIQELENTEIKKAS